ncbi:Glu-tRNA(Gln) amidotransferase subunit GatD [Candidatus Woesearchaeota archaeon]|nr:Glu-tRNA(Gln) amidotransferase subunit GatD [Candidatus Woesearchaeota archaeon]
MTYKAGDMVKVVTKDEMVEGIVLPRPDILEGDFLVVKLDSGYNIGIDQKKIKKIEVLKKAKATKEKKIKLKHNPKLPKVSFLSYGGTISSKVDYDSGGVSADLTAEDFVSMAPELEEIANLKAKKEMSVMSEDMNFGHWAKMASDVARELNSGADGVVVTQGTDTLHYTTTALSFFLKNLKKPVIVTASQRSIDRGSSDAFINLICAVRAAGHLKGAGVFSCLHGSSNDDYCILIRGTKVRKMHTSRRDAFRPINELPIAKVYPDKKDIDVLNKNFEKRGKGKVIAQSKYEENIAMIFIHPAMDPGVIDYYIKRGVKGIVLMATALGHVPTQFKKYSLLPNLKKAKDKKIPIIIATQTIYGRVHPLVYTNLRKLSIELGAIYAEDMLCETAFVKLGWVLGQTKDYSKIKELMLTNFAGEINENIDDKSFLY